jgi:hypothetical protein
MLSVLYFVVASLMPMPQSLPDLPPNREGLPGRRLEVVTVKLEEDDSRSSKEPNKYFSRKVVKTRQFNRTGTRQSPFV